jgi:hypothetical protein
MASNVCSSVCEREGTRLILLCGLELPSCSTGAKDTFELVRACTTLLLDGELCCETLELVRACPCEDDERALDTELDMLSCFRCRGDAWGELVADRAGISPLMGSQLLEREWEGLRGSFINGP